MADEITRPRPVGEEEVHDIQVTLKSDANPVGVRDLKVWILIVKRFHIFYWIPSCCKIGVNFFTKEVSLKLENLLYVWLVCKETHICASKLEKLSTWLNTSTKALQS